MSCSTYTVRSTSFGGKPSSLPLAMDRMSVDCGKRKYNLVESACQAGSLHDGAAVQDSAGLRHQHAGSCNISRIASCTEPHLTLTLPAPLWPQRPYRRPRFRWSRALFSRILPPAGCYCQSQRPLTCARSIRKQTATMHQAWNCAQRQSRAQLVSVCTAGEAALANTQVLAVPTTNTCAACACAP